MRYFVKLFCGNGIGTHRNPDKIIYTEPAAEVRRNTKENLKEIDVTRASAAFANFLELHNKVLK